jgi:hypothetical protein
MTTRLLVSCALPTLRAQPPRRRQPRRTDPSS